MRRPTLTALLAALMVMAMALGASAAVAGEITGNGKTLWTGEGSDDPAAHHTLNGKSLCAFSGQEDNQWYNEDGSEVDPVVKGEPGHAQSWGQIPKEVRDFLATIGEHPSDACNPTRGPLHE
jgi:hypothetical protein